MIIVKRFLFLTIVIVMLCAVLTGCGSKEKETVVINIKLPILTLLSGEETDAEAAAGIDGDCNRAITYVEKKLHE